MKNLARKEEHELATWAAAQLDGRLLKYLKRRVASVSDAQDLLQTVYEKLLSVDRRRIVAPIAYVFRVAAQTLHEHHDRRKRLLQRLAELREELPLLDVLPSAAHAHGVDEHLEREAQLNEALLKLPPVHAVTLLLHKRDGMTYEECAKRLTELYGKKYSANMARKYVIAGLAELRALDWEL